MSGLRRWPRGLPSTAVLAAIVVVGALVEARAVSFVLTSVA